MKGSNHAGAGNMTEMPGPAAAPRQDVEERIAHAGTRIAALQRELDAALAIRTDDALALREGLVLADRQLAAALARRHD